MKIIKKSALHLLLILGCIVGTRVLVSLVNWVNVTAYGYSVHSKENVADRPDLSLMSHRMIAFDESHHVISESGASFAWGNTRQFFQAVKKRCSPAEARTTEQYLSCANAILGEYFYYRPSAPVSTAWAGHYSDCDLNVYLLLDALRLAGKHAEIVYAPGHAFIHFTDEKTGHSQFWETTSAHNKGRLSVFGDKSLYEENKNAFYYTPEPAEFAERLYPMLLLNNMHKADRESTLNKLMAEFPGNPMVLDYWYADKPALTAEDIRNLNALLKTDTTSTDKRLILARYWFKQGDRHMAGTYLKQISDFDCDLTCLKLKAETSFYHRLVFLTEKAMRKLRMPLEAPDRTLSVYLTLFIWLLIILYFSAVTYRNAIKKRPSPQREKGKPDTAD